MQRVSKPLNAHEQGRSQARLHNHGVLSEEESDAEEAIVDDGHHDEIGDILASQHHPGMDEEVEDDGPQDAWWKVVQDEGKVSSAGSVLDLGSPRIDLESLTLLQTRASPSARARRRLDLQSPEAEVNSSYEESEFIHDVEDLLPPAPRPPLRAFAKAPVEDSDDEEDGASSEMLLLSPTPQPRPRRANDVFSQASPSPRLTISPQRPAESAGRQVWMFEPKPPTLSDLVASSKQLGIEAMEVRAWIIVSHYHSLMVCLRCSTNLRSTA
jgi:hypothetical protein